MRLLLPARPVVPALITLLLTVGAAGADHLAPEMLPAGDPAWKDLLRLELSGAIPAGLTSMQPVSRGEVAAWVAKAAEVEGVDRASLARLQRAFARELRRSGIDSAARETDPLIRLTGEAEPGSKALDSVRSELRIGPTLAVQVAGSDEKADFGDSTRAGIYGVYLIGRSVAIQGELFVGEIEDGRKIADPLIHGTDILYFSEDLGAAFSTEELSLRLARGRHRWGPGTGSTLLLDHGAAPISFLEYEMRLPAGLRFRSWVGSLNIYEERGIAAHRLEIPIGSNLRIAISEGVRYVGGPEHPLYLLGLLPYTLVQRLDEQDTSVDSLKHRQRNNVLAQAEVVWRPRPGFMTYSEFLVDDLPAESAENPARIGGRLGFAFLPIVVGEPLQIRIEATKISRYAYAVFYPGAGSVSWIHQDTAIGESSGPDQEALRLWIGRSFGRDHHLQLHGLYANRGSGRLGEAWIATGEHGSELTRRALTVSGPVERDRRVAMIWRWDPKDNLFIETEAAIARLRHHVEDKGTQTDVSFLFAGRIGWRM